MLFRHLFVALACFGLYCCPVLSAEEPKYLPIYTWRISNNDYFNSLLKYYYHSYFCSEEELEAYMAWFDFPEEIDSQSAWGGMKLTDGKEIWNVAWFWVKDEYSTLESMDHAELRRKILSHPIIYALFENDGPQVTFSEAKFQEGVFHDISNMNTSLNRTHSELTLDSIIQQLEKNESQALFQDNSNTKATPNRSHRELILDTIIQPLEHNEAKALFQDNSNANTTPNRTHRELTLDSIIQQLEKNESQALFQDNSNTKTASKWHSDSQNSFLGSLSRHVVSRPLLFITSKSLPHDEQVNSLMVSRWTELANRAPVALLFESPDRILLPVLPPKEPSKLAPPLVKILLALPLGYTGKILNGAHSLWNRSDESPFVKYVRQQRKDGKTPKAESVFYGIQWDHDSWEFLYESVAAEETEDAELYRRWTSLTEPFQVGGFCGGPEGIDLCWRIVPDTLFNNFYFHGGTMLIPLEDREKNGDTTYHFRAAFGKKVLFVSDMEELKQYGMVLSDGSLYCIYPHQPEVIGLEEGLATPETLDAINKTFAENMLALLVGLRDSAMSSGGDKPVDVAAQFEEEGIYIAFAFPPEFKCSIEALGWNAFQKPIDVVAEMLLLPRLDDDGKVIPGEDWQGSVRLSDLETYDGITYRTFDVAMPDPFDFEKDVTLSGVFGIGEDFFCAAFSNPGDQTNDLNGENTMEIFLTQLKQKVQASRHLQEEGMQTPITLVRGNLDGLQFRLTNETIGRKTTYRMKVDANSLNNIYSFTRQYGFDAIKSMLPF